MRNLYIILVCLTATVLPMTAAAQSEAARATHSSDTDWTGLRLGLAHQHGISDPAGQTAPGVFAGYDRQDDNLVLGVEMKFTQSDPTGAFAALDDQTAFRARVGLARRKWLVYGVAGYVRGDVVTGSTREMGDGATIGLGAEMSLGNGIFAGAEIDGVRITHGGAGSKSTLNHGVAQLRLGLQF